MKKKFMHVLVAISASLSIAGCASGYKEFYTPTPGATPEAIASTRASAAPQTPAVERSAFGNTDQLLAGYPIKN